MRARLWAFVAWAALAASGAGPARAAQCGDTPGGFTAWLDDFKQVAINDGVSPNVVDEALATAKFDPSVLSHDRGQGALQGNQASFAAGHITPSRVKHGKSMMLAYAEPLERIEQRYGVPGPVLVAIWGLETDYGAALGKYLDLQRTCDAGLRLPTGLPLPGGADRRADDRAAGAPVAGTDARSVGGRAWPDPVHALGLP